jgi:hypothetical protein
MRFWLLAALLCGSLPAAAAHVTDVADAGDERHPLEVDVDVTYDHTRRETRITREQSTANGILLVDELQHFETVDEIGFRLNVGLWHDLELHALAPLVINDTQNWRYADVNGVSVESASTLKNNHINISGCGAPGLCDPSAAPQPIVPVPGQSQRKGLRDPTIGLAWGPINELREVKLRPELFPPDHPVATWVVAFDYTLPVGSVDDPSIFGFNTGSPTGSVARKAHVFTLWTAFSKRYSVVEPYFRVSASAPVASPAAYDNCNHKELLADVAQVNCDGAWHGQTAYKPPFYGSFWLGTEVVALEGPRGDQRLSFDVRGTVDYRGPGRDYTQITDALGKLTFTDEYMTVTGQLGIYGRIARWLHARVYGTVGFDTAHIITHEDIGDDKDGDGKITLSAGSGRPAPDQNPLYDFRLDQVGRRLRAEPSLIWGVAASLALNF